MSDARFDWRYWRRFNLPQLTYVLILLLVAGLTYWWIRNDLMPAPPTIERSDDRVDAYAKDAQVSQTDATGRITYLAKFKTAEHMANQDIKGQEVVVEASQVNKPTVIAKSKEALWQKEAQQVTMKGDVELWRDAYEGNPAMRLTTTELVIDVARGVATSPAAYVFTQGGNEIRGTGMRYDYQLRNLDMGVGSPKPGQGGRVRAQLESK